MASPDRGATGGIVGVQSLVCCDLRRVKQKMRLWINAHWPSLSNLVGRTFGLRESSFMSGLDDQIPTAFDPFADANADDSGAGSKEYVHIRVQQRNGRKSLTTVQGLKKEFSYNKILKDVKKEFCCNGTVVQDPELGQVIQLQGDQRKNVSTFLVQAGIVKKDHIKIHGLSNLVGRTFGLSESSFMSELDDQIPTAFDPFADANADDSGAGSKEYVHIRVQQRNGRKSLTTVQGLKKEFSYNKILKDVKKEFCCNGTVVQDPELGQVIQLQGDQRKNVSTFLVQAGIVKKDHIKIHGF
ncbi:Protein translation factor SUI1 1 [Glycine max]|nr:Protein translation factor SUI1 1 [Glycine max]